MATGTTEINAMQVIGNPTEFDRRSGNLLERLVFNNRLLFIVI